MSTIANFALIWAYVKNMPGWLFWACLPLHLAMKLVTTVVFVMCGNGRGILRAKCDALLGLPKMRRKRQEIQKGACCFLPVCVRKPGPGMILQVAGEFNVDLAKSVVVGDKETDIQAGVAGGGGFMMFFVAPEKRMNAIRTLNSFDGQVSNCHFTKYGSQAWRV